MDLNDFITNDESTVDEQPVATSGFDMGDNFIIREYNDFFFIEEITIRKSVLDFTNTSLYSAYNIYMINKWLSMADPILPLIERINHFNWEKEDHYNCLKSLIPECRLELKWQLPKANDKELEMMRLISKYYVCGTRDAKYILSIMSDENKKELKDVYRYGSGALAI